MNQLPFEWHHRPEVPATVIILDPATIEIVIALMASALIVVVRGVTHVEEVDDDAQ